MVVIENAWELKELALNEEGVKISTKDCEMILGYFEGHDYEIVLDSEGKLYVADVYDRNDKVEETFKGILSIVSHWNICLIEGLSMELDCKKDTLRENERRIDKLLAML